MFKNLTCSKTWCVQKLSAECARELYVLKTFKKLRAQNLRTFKRGHVHSFTDSLIHRFICQSFTDSFIHRFTHSPIHSFTDSFIHRFIYSPIRLFSDSLIHGFTHSPIRSLTDSLIHLFILRFTHSPTD